MPGLLIGKSPSSCPKHFHRAGGLDLAGKDATPSDLTNASGAARQFLRLLVSTLPDSMVAIDQHATIIAFSASAAAMFGYDKDEVIGRNVSLLMPSPDRERHDGYVHEYLRTGVKAIIGTGRLVKAQRKNGETFSADLSVHETIISDRPVFIGFLHDATDQERQRRRLATLSADLARASRISSMGLLSSAIAHEVNQPLTAIRNYVETILMISHGDAPIDRTLLREALEACNYEATRASEIIRRLRQFMTRGDSEPARESLMELAKDAVALAIADGEGVGVTVELLLDDAADAVLVDGIQIQQVLFNLIRNALQAMGNQEFRHLIIRSKLYDAMVEVIVEDTGPGIASEQQSQLFLPFSISKSDGLGLGLSITRMIIEAHGGRIWIGKSDLGGASFHFTIPVMPDSAELET